MTVIKFLCSPMLGFRCDFCPMAPYVWRPDPGHCRRGTADSPLSSAVSRRSILGNYAGEFNFDRCGSPIGLDCDASPWSSLSSWPAAIAADKWHWKLDSPILQVLGFCSGCCVDAAVRGQMGGPCRCRVTFDSVLGGMRRFGLSGGLVCVYGGKQQRRSWFAVAYSWQISHRIPCYSFWDAVGQFSNS